MVKNKNPWYAAGLHFGCIQCGECCAGPQQGYIWVTKPEIKLIADFLKISDDELTRKYLRRVHFRTTIKEQSLTRDCMFLQVGAVSQEGYPQNDIGRSFCRIYPVRPNQCRTWPFWSGNLASPAAWNRAAHKCPGVNRGRFYCLEEIERLKNQKKWWTNAAQSPSSKQR